MTTPRSTKRPTCARQIAPKTSEKKRKTDDGAREDEIDVLKSVSRALLAPEPKKDEEEIFGELVASRLRKLKPGRAKMLAEKLISDALYNAALDQQEPDYYVPSQSYYPHSSSVGHAVTPHSSIPPTSASYNYADSPHCISNLPSDNGAPSYTNLDHHQIR